MKRQFTLGEAASQWAKQHPDACSRIVVRRLVRKGQDGWNCTAKYTVFFVRDGQAARAHTGHDDLTFNGICQVCGTVYLETVLRVAFAPDQEAGRPVEKYSPLFEADHVPRVVGKYGWLSACPGCVRKHTLRTRDYEGGWTKGGQVYELLRPHPTLIHFDRSMRERLARVVIGRQRPRISASRVYSATRACTSDYPSTAIPST